ncbi:hypothetical protein Tco_1036221 [Tanacetum coccineum]
MPVSSLVPVLSPSPPDSPICTLGYLAVMIRLRAEVVSTSHLLLLPPPIILSHTRPDAPSSGTPPLHLLSTDRREDRPEVTLPPRKRLGIALGPAYEVGESLSAAAARPAGVLGQLWLGDTDEIYTRLDDEQSGRQLLAGRLNMLFRDRRAHAHGDYRDAGGRSQEAEAAHRGTEADKETSDSDDRVRETAGTRQRSCTPELPEEAGSSS